MSFREYSRHLSAQWTSPMSPEQDPGFSFAEVRTSFITATPETTRSPERVGNDRVEDSQDKSLGESLETSRLGSSRREWNKELEKRIDEALDTEKRCFDEKLAREKRKWEQETQFKVDALQAQMWVQFEKEMAQILEKERAAGRREQSISVQDLQAELLLSKKRDEERNTELAQERAAFTLRLEQMQQGCNQKIQNCENEARFKMDELANDLKNIFELEKSDITRVERERCQREYDAVLRQERERWEKVLRSKEAEVEEKVEEWIQTREIELREHFKQDRSDALKVAASDFESTLRRREIELISREKAKHVTSSDEVRRALEEELTFEREKLIQREEKLRRQMEQAVSEAREDEAQLAAAEYEARLAAEKKRWDEMFQEMVQKKNAEISRERSVGLDACKSLEQNLKRDFDQEKFECIKNERRREKKKADELLQVLEEELRENFAKERADATRKLHTEFQERLKSMEADHAHVLEAERKKWELELAREQEKSTRQEEIFQLKIEQARFDERAELDRRFAQEKKKMASETALLKMEMEDKLRFSLGEQEVELRAKFESVRLGLEAEIASERERGEKQEKLGEMRLEQAREEEAASLERKLAQERRKLEVISEEFKRELEHNYRIKLKAQEDGLMARFERERSELEQLISRAEENLRACERDRDGDRIESEKRLAEEKKRLVDLLRDQREENVIESAKLVLEEKKRSETAAANLRAQLEQHALDRLKAQEAEMMLRMEKERRELGAEVGRLQDKLRQSERTRLDEKTSLESEINSLRNLQNETDRRLADERKRRESEPTLPLRDTIRRESGDVKLRIDDDEFSKRDRRVFDEPISPTISSRDTLPLPDARKLVDSPPYHRRRASLPDQSDFRRQRVKFHPEVQYASMSVSQVFAVIDNDRSGTLSKFEVQKGLGKMFGESAAEVVATVDGELEKMSDVIGIDDFAEVCQTLKLWNNVPDSGRMDNQKQFLQRLRFAILESKTPSIRATFNLFQKNDALTLSDFTSLVRSVLPKSSLAEMRQSFNGCDTGTNGEIGLEAFYSLVQSV